MKTGLMIFISVAALILLIWLLYLLLLVRPRAKKPPKESLSLAYAHRGLLGNGIP